MKCPNCNSELLEGAKFCTSCGAPVALAKPATAVCRNCHAPLLPGAGFCTSCGTPVAPETPRPVQAPEESGELASVKQRIFWNIQRGEIACRINEAEFVRYDSAQGLIVNDGTTAVIRANGEKIAEIHGGIYDFIAPEELEKLLESRHGGAVGLLAGGARFLVNAVLGRRVKDNFRSDGSEVEKQRSLDALLECLKRKDAFSLQLKLDKSFSLVFGSGTAEKTAEFAPMTVRTPLHDMQIGVRAIFRIADFGRFAEYFLADERVATTRRIAALLQPTVQYAVQSVLQDSELTDTTLPAGTTERIAAQIAASQEQFHGLVLEQVAEVVAANEDFERFRSLNRELYLSEQELDYLRRTNDFRNRLSSETNAQAVADARSDLQLYQGLQEVNKDRLLAEDELDKFFTVLSREKRIRDARSEDEVETAMAEIAKTGLLREEDIENLRLDIAERGYRRGQALRLMQLKDEVEFEKARTAGEGEIAMETMRRNLELQDMTIAGRRKEDEYADERRAKELELEDAEMAAQIERLRKIKEINREDKRLEHEQELEKERLEMEHALERERMEAQMSAEQIMAIGARENLDAEGAKAYAQSFSAGRDAEQARRDADKRMAEAQRQQEMMWEMMRRMQQTTETMSGNIARHKDEVNDEYRSRLERQEQRIEHTQDSALEYATRNNRTAAPQQPAGCTCPDCGAEVASGVRFCPCCGREIK